MEEEFSEEFKAALQEDQSSVDDALDHLIESISIFKGSDGIESISMEDWGHMLAALDYGKYVISGIMYSYGMVLNVHAHTEDIEEED